MSSLFRLVALFLALFVSGIWGCEHGADTTKMTQYMTASEGSPSWQRIPPELAGGNPVVFATVPGKNVKLTIKKTADGALDVSYDGNRSAVLDAIFAGVKAEDALKFAENAENRKLFLDIAQMVVGLIKDYYPPGALRVPVPGSGGATTQPASQSIQDMIRSEVKAAMPELVTAIKGAILQQASGGGK